MHETTPPTSVVDDRLPARDKTIITILLVSAFVVILNETAMNVALDAVIEDLHVDERLAQWLTSAFLLTMATVIPTTGWLMERCTTRSVYIAAMSLFTAGTLIAAVSGGFWMLLAGRIVQAMGTALVLPLMMTTIMTLVPAHKRGAVMGNVSLVIACAPALGPTVSGLILQWMHWRFVFLLVLPIAIVAGVIGTLRMINVGEPTKPRLDVLSVPLAGLGFGGVVFALSAIGDATAPAWELPAAASIGVLGLLAFVLRQRWLQRRDEALLDLRTLRFGNFTRTVLVMMIAMMAMFGAIIALPLVLQRALGYEPIVVGLITLPGALLMGLLGPVVGRLYDRVGPRPLMVPGAIVVLVALLTFTLVQPDSAWWFFVGVHMVLSLGLAFTFPVLFTISLGSLPSSLYSHGSAMVATVQQVAGAAGTAVFVTILTTTSASLAAEGVEFTPAYVEGARMAFLFAAALWIVGIALTLTLRKPADEIVDKVHGHVAESDTGTLDEVVTR